MKKIIHRFVAVFMSLSLVIISIFQLNDFKVNAQVTLNGEDIKNYVLGKDGNSYPNGMCLKFVEECYQNLGVNRPYQCCASKSGNTYIESNSMTDIPLGATVYFGNCGGGPCKSCGSSYYGHVGIYVGDGYFVHATGGWVQKTPLSRWANKYRGWGRCGGFSLNNSSVCNCSESYKGYYVVSTNSLPLTMRSGHGSNYSQVTTIPKGTVVYVSKADGAWAHVEWNGLCGYCSMQYLTRNVEAPTIYVWASQTQMGDCNKVFYRGRWIYLCYELKEPGSGTLFNSVAPNHNYQITETFYNQNGNVVFTYTYDNTDNSWIGQSLEPGKYKGVVSISGDYEGSCTVEFEVKDAKTVFENWISYEKNGKQNIVYNFGETCYLNYKLYEEYSGKKLTDIFDDLEFEVSESLYAPNGNCVYSNKYNNSCLENHVIQLNQSGVYTYNVSLLSKGKTIETQTVKITVNNLITPTPIVTRKPTLTPSVTPIVTRKPTQMPSATPIVTRKPTPIPTLTPTATINPTQTPLPTTDATLAPTATIQPSNETATTDENTADDQEELWYSGLEEGDVFEVGNGYYEITDLEDGNGEVTYLSPISMKNQSEVIPASVVYEDIKFKVTAIDEGAFKKHKTLTSVTIGANIQRIGAYAFYKAKKLETITIKSSKITKMGKKSFYGIKTKAKVKVPSKVKGKYKKMLVKAGLGKR